MRNLKRVLSLALATVMLLGMMIVGTSAANASESYTDAASIGNHEAASVLKALGIFTGEGDGSFNPNGAFTRGQMAVLVVRMSQGTSFAPGLFNDLDTFEDYGDYYWARGSINYAGTTGLLKGDGQRHFYPELDITVGQAAKLLLNAIGVTTSDTDNYVEAMNEAYKLGLLDDLGVTSSGAKMTREMVAVMTFNTLNASPDGDTAYVVTYTDEDGESQTVDCGTDYDLAKLTMVVKNGIISTKKSNENSLGRKSYKLIDDTTTDGFGRTVKTWKVDGKVVYTANTSTTAPVVIYTAGGVTADQVKKATGASSDSVPANKVYINGVAQSGANITISTGLTGNGKTVEVYASNKTIDKVVVIAPSVYTLNADPTTRTNNDKTEVRIPGMIGVWTDAAKVTGWEDLAKGDVVLCLKDKNGNYTIEKADTVTGTVTSYNSSKGVQVNGSYYAESGLIATPLSTWNSDANKFKTAYTFYLDATGSVVKAVPADSAASTESSYAIVRDVAWFAGSGFTPNGYMQAKILKTDGTYETVNVASVDGVVPVDGGILVSKVTDDGYALKAATQTLADTKDTATAAHAAVVADTTKVVAGEYWTTSTTLGTSTASDVSGRYYGATNSNLTGGGTALITLDQFYAYTVNSDGEYVLTNLGTIATEDHKANQVAAAITTGKVAFDGTNLGNASTVFLFDNGNGKTPDIYVGINSVPTTAALSAVAGKATMVIGGDSFAKFVFVTGATVQNTSTDVVYIADTTYSEIADGKVLNAFINGEPGTITVASVPSVGLYTVTSVNDKGVSTLSSAIGMKTGIVSNTGSVITVKDTSNASYLWDNETVVYVVEGADDKATMTQVTAADIEADGNDTIHVIVDPANTSRAATIYVVKVDAPKPDVTLEKNTGNDMTVFPTLTNNKMSANNTVKMTMKDNNDIKVTVAAAPANYSRTVTATKDGATDTSVKTDGTAFTVSAGTYVITVTVTDSFNSNNVETYTYTIEVAAKPAA